jgi:anti-sigma factor RsiW
MEISCEHVWREVSNYLDGEVDAELRAAVEEHVRGCRRCAAVLDGTRNVLQLIGDERVLELPVAFEQRLRQKLAAEALRGKTKKNYVSWLVLATAAALAVGAFSIGGSASRQPRLRSEMAHPAAGVPATLVVFVAADGKMFHVAGCRLLHDKAKVSSMPASEALLKGYSPCVHCMKQYLSAGRMLPSADHSSVGSEPELALQ